jgi:hypothetical protein
MSYKPTKADKLNVSEVTFSQDKKKPSQIYMNDGDHSIFLEAPELDVRYDCGDFFPRDDRPDSGKYLVKTFMEGHNVENSKVKVFCDKMVELDEVIMKVAQENSVAWFKKKNMSRDAVESVYTPIVKMAVDRETGEVDESRSPEFKFKIAQWDGKVNCKIFDGNKKEVNINGKDKEDYKKVGIVRPFKEQLAIPHEGLFKKNSKVRVVLRCKGIWIFNNKFGCTWQAEQIGLKAPPSFDDYAFLDSDEETETGDKLAPGNFVDSSSDEEDGHELTRTDTKKA